MTISSHVIRLGALLILLMVISACTVQEIPVEITLTNTVEEGPVYNLVTADPRATATPTPFQPAPATATATLPPTPTITLTPTPRPRTATPTRTNIPEGWEAPAGQVNILLLGSDLRPATGGFRTDVIVLASIHPHDGEIHVVSFPRDLFIEIPGYGTNRINTAFSFGGFNLLADTFQYNFGIRPDHYVLITFDSFLEMIERLDGIDVEIAEPLSDKCALTNGLASYGWCSVNPGVMHMDGQTALWYVRSRYTTNDFDRTRRAQEVLKGIMKGMLKLDVLAHAPRIFEKFGQFVETDIHLGDMLPLLPMIPHLQNENIIQQHYIGPAETYNYIVPGNGAMVLLPNYAAIQSVIQQATTGE